MKNILIVTGGSGGHVVPSLNISDHLSNKFFVKIVSDLRGSKFINKNNYNFEIVDVPNIFSKFYFFPLKIIKYLISIFHSILFIHRNKIDILISTGGYMTFPFCIAAILFKKKIFLFEPNSSLGRSNKIILKFASKIFCYHSGIDNFPKKYNFKKVIIDPILNKEFYKIEKKNNMVKDNFMKLLIIGGSQGASFFDDKITDIIVEISKKHKLNIYQQISNKGKIQLIKEKYNRQNIEYKFFNFTNDYKEIFNEVDLAITRGGAITLSELSFLNIPFIAIPLPTAKDNHQYHNAAFYYKKNCCWLIEQSRFNKDKVSKIISNIFVNKSDYFDKIRNLKKISEKNIWNNLNNHIIEIIDEN
tara:strand:- start:1481 stop:2557 length:1077 start_codon:yes stop_codon:yes gene_type:complete